VIYGSREARPSPLRRLVSRAMARELDAFVVPGLEIARARGLDLEAAGLRPSGTPRHASVLVLVGGLPVGFKKAAAVAYAQMPRPRAILAVGAGDVAPLPGPNVSVPPGQEELAGGVAALRSAFAEGAFSAEVEDFDVDDIRTRTEYVCPMHPDVVRDEPGSCPKCGMDLVPREAGGGDHGHTSHQGMAHGHAAHGGGERGATDGGTGDEAGAQHEDPDAEHGESGDDDHEGHGGDSGEHEGMDHGDMGDGGHDHGDMGFMSMVEMTQGMPRSSDGLQMEWVEAPFGPLFPGLPGGLSLALTLDGDTVAGAQTDPGVEGWEPHKALTGPADALADKLALLDPLSPVSYRLLALRALEDAAGASPDERAAFARVGALERERAMSHLNWLALFARLLGYPWLEERAGRLVLALSRAEDAEGLARFAGAVGKLARRVDRTPLLRRRLREIGGLEDDSAKASGPVARAAGVAWDTRDDEEVYRSLGFAPVVRDGDDALSRLRVRLAETLQSLDLAKKAGAVLLADGTVDGATSGTGAATVETPRGPARLEVTLEGGAVVAARLDTPSSRHLALVGAVAEQREVADALVGVASLDLSPWEVVR
jgi:Ni,Fe-hydrogenase III large subunit